MPLHSPPPPLERQKRRERHRDRERQRERQRDRERGREILLPNIHEDMAVIPSVLGERLVVLLNMLMSTRNRVTSSAMRPGTTFSMVFILDGYSLIDANV